MKHFACWSFIRSRLAKNTFTFNPTLWEMDNGYYVAPETS
jgi:hypothetical protein